MERATHFNTFGFEVMPSLIAAADMTALALEFDACMNDAFADAGHMIAGATGNQFRYVPTMCERTPQALGLIRRLASVAAELLGSPVLPSRAKATTYSGSTTWHRDSDLSVASIGFLFYLEPLGPESGALRVLPGSHWPDFALALATYLACGIELLGTAVPTRPGDAIAFNERLYHASSNGGLRRQWRVDFVADQLGPDDGLREYFARQYSPGWDGGYDVDRYPTYGEHWRTLDARWNERLGELGAYQVAANEEAFVRARRKAARDSM